jgi:high-affinity iron transporter
MLASALITLREGLEAALIVGIVLGVLRKLGHTDRSRVVWAGVLAAVVVSATAGFSLNALGVALEGRGEEIFEGVAMLLAAGVLTWMIFWMQRQGRHIQAELELDVHRAATTSNVWALFSLAFVAVVREGIETVLFLTAAAFSATPAQTLIGSAVGLVVAVALGWLMFAAGKRLDVRAFFRVTSVLLILFAAGLVAHGVHELQEAGLLPTLVEHVWDINPILDENSTMGSILKALFGYNGNPSLLETVSYAAYYLMVGVVIGLEQRIAISKPEFSGHPRKLPAPQRIPGLRIGDGERCGNGSNSDLLYAKRLNVLRMGERVSFTARCRVH